MLIRNKRSILDTNKTWRLLPIASIITPATLSVGIDVPPPIYMNVPNVEFSSLNLAAPGRVWFYWGRRWGGDWIWLDVCWAESHSAENQRRGRRARFHSAGCITIGELDLGFGLQRTLPALQPRKLWVSKCSSRQYLELHICAKPKYHRS